MVDNKNWDQKVQKSQMLGVKVGSYQNLNKVLMGKGIESVRSEFMAIGLEDNVVNALCEVLRNLGVHEDRMFKGILVGPTPISTLGALFFAIDILIRDRNFTFDDFALFLTYLESVEGLESSFDKVSGSDPYIPDPRYTNFNFYLSVAISEFRGYLSRVYESKGEVLPLTYAFRFNELLANFCNHSQLKYSQALIVNDNLNRGFLHIISMHQDPLKALVFDDGFIFIELYTIVAGFILSNPNGAEQDITFSAFEIAIENIVRSAINRFLVENMDLEASETSIGFQLKAIEFAKENNKITLNQYELFKGILDHQCLVPIDNIEMQNHLIDWFLSHDPRIELLSNLIKSVLNRRVGFNKFNFHRGKFLTMWPMPES